MEAGFEITVRGAAEKKRLIEICIQDQLEEFERETGLIITDVDITRTITARMDQRNGLEESRLSDVALKVYLRRRNTA